MENNGNYIGLKRYTESAKMFFETLRDTNLANNKHCIKSVRIRSFSSPHFPPFGLDTERYGVSLHIQSQCGKVRTRKTPNTATFHAGKHPGSSKICWNFHDGIIESTSYQCSSFTSIHSEVFCKKGVLKNFPDSQENTCV